MTRPELTVVVASVNGFPYLGRCLDALDQHGAGAEVIVADATDEPTRERVAEAWPHVRLVSFDEPMPVPLLRAAGIKLARAPYVAVIEDHCVVRPGWAIRIVGAHRRGHAVVGGSIGNGSDRRIRDWAAFLCEYSEHMRPVRTGTAASLPGMNVSYDRPAIEAMGPLLDDGCWETWLHPHLRACGFALYADDSIQLDHVRDLDVGVFLRQRYQDGRVYAGRRNHELGWKRAGFLVASPAVVPLALYRITRNVLERRRLPLRMVLGAPLVLLYAVAWTTGETIGYALGAGDSALVVR